MKKERIIEAGMILLFVLIVFVVFVKYYGDKSILPGFNQYSFDKYVNYGELQNEISLQGLNNQKPESGFTNSVPIINFHGITPEPTSGSVTVEQFKEQMFALKKAGYQTVKLKDLYLFMQGKKKLPKKSIVITFDDGRKDSYYNSDLILKSLNYNAVMFVIAYYSIEKNPPSKYYLNLSELKQMDSSGRWELQEHAYIGHGHIPTGPNGQTGAFYGNREWLAEKNRFETDAEYLARISQDLDKGKALLEQEFKKPIYAFALPFGDYGQNTTNDPRVSTILSNTLKKDYGLVLYQYKPSAEVDYRANYNDKVQNFYFGVRISVNPTDTAEQLLQTVEASQERSLPYIETFSNNNNWVKSWGSYFENQKTLVVGSETGKTALAYIDGSYLWKDYLFLADIKNDENTTSSLVVRFKDSYNYALCNFGNNQVSIETLKNNRHFIIKAKTAYKDNVANGFNYLSLGAKVYGNSIDCLVGGQVVLSGESPDIPSNGGAGIRFWSINPDKKTTTISSISVLPVSTTGTQLSLQSPNPK